METFDISVLFMIIAAVTALTNIIVQVLKKSLWDKLPTNLLALIVAVALTLAAFFAYTAIKSIVVEWYMIVAAVVVGFLAAYAAMFGFDKLKEALGIINSKK